MKWYVHQKFYDDGTVMAEINNIKGENFVETDKYDYWCDEFNNEVDAVKFYKEVLKA